MKTGTKSFLIVLAVASLTTTGCKSTSWKMPGASWLSANREPDAATLAGTEEVPDLPVSPASKYSPDNIASVGTQNGPTSSGSTSAYGYTAQTVATPKAGLAAQANGYQTGPYQVGTNASSSTGTGGMTAPTGSPYGALPNPYGGTYGMAGSTTTPDLSTPGTATVAGGSAVNPSTYPGPTGTYPNTGSASAYTGSMTGASSSTAALPASYPTVNSGTVPPAAVNSSMPSYPSLPYGTAGTAYQGNTTIGASSGGAAGASSPTPSASPTMPDTGSYAPGAAGGYAPGTTGRSTSYDFGSSSTPLIASPPNTTLQR